ncbi:ShlB/FhaC/HecB family hemolysin secretion/activation protein [Oscillatoria sp. CS-180]|nr:ShlB/FhaC/HecB family hemolysin secretion/activation protein [Oscillatoria sp. CS-180]
MPPPTPSLELPELPPLDDLLPAAPTEPRVPETLPIESPETIVVERFEVLGSTIFSDAELEDALRSYTQRPITFSELLDARSVVTQLYLDAGYATSGAFIPAEQIVNDGEVTIAVIEGAVAAIEIQGLTRLREEYVVRRIEQATGAPLNLNRLLEALQLLQLDPRIETISADLQDDIKPGQSSLFVELTEADTLSADLFFDNGQSASVGSFRRGGRLTELNLTGRGDIASTSYSNTEGSNTLNFSYRFPVNSRGGSINLDYEYSHSRRVDDSAFSFLNLETRSHQLAVGIRQPILQTPLQELALGISLGYEISRTTAQPEGFERFGFPIVGAPDGEIRVTTLRFLQEWNQRSDDRFLGVRSQFSLGTPWFGSTVNAANIPDSEFLSWQIQGQWVQQLATNTLLVGRISGQWADRALLPTEQFRAGGIGSVRGYQQDQFRGDNGIFASLETRLPVITIPEWDSLMSVAPFVDYAYLWDSDTGSNTQELFAVGAGLIWQIDDWGTARLDWGIPLTDSAPEGNSWQENGLIFSITGSF